MERRIWLARLPQTRIAYFELQDALAVDDKGTTSYRWDRIGEFWESFNDWRVRTRPALGRIDIAAFGLMDETARTFRAAVPVRGDYAVPAPARAAVFPGGSFAYVYADNWDEIDGAADAARAWIDEQGLRRASDLIEAYKFHYNPEQHPCDAGYLVLNADGTDPLGPSTSHAAPLPIAGRP